LWARRWIGVWRSEAIHGAELGHSWLAPLLPVPPAVTETVIVPLLVTLIGYGLIKTVSVALGFWLMLCGISLALLSLWEYRRRRAWHRMYLDDTISARAQDEGVRYHAQGGAYARRGPSGPHPFVATVGTAATSGARAFLNWWWRK
jgi:hypothetical protein